MSRFRPARWIPRPILESSEIASVVTSLGSCSVSNAAKSGRPCSGRWWLAPVAPARRDSRRRTCPQASGRGHQPSRSGSMDPAGTAPRTRHLGAPSAPSTSRDSTGRTSWRPSATQASGLGHRPDREGQAGPDLGRRSDTARTASRIEPESGLVWRLTAPRWPRNAESGGTPIPRLPVGLPQPEANDPPTDVGRCSGCPAYPFPSRSRREKYPAPRSRDSTPAGRVLRSGRVTARAIPARVPGSGARGGERRAARAGHARACSLTASYLQPSA
jgi:hypothetical protein